MKRITIIFIGVLCVFINACEEVINEQNIADKQLELLAPTNNANLVKGTRISYNWLEVEGASAYHLQLATPNFHNASQIPIDTIITKIVFSVDSLPVGEYEWRVKALNSVYETAYTTNGFTVMDE
jgi:hypothetical protein